MAAPQLQPLPQPLALFDHMMARQSQTLVIKEKSFDDFDIKGMDGTRWMHVKGKMASMSGRKKVYGPDGAYLFDVVKRHFKWHTTFSVQKEDKTELMEVKSKFALVGSKANATFTTARGNAVTLAMKGSWLDTSADIVDQASGAPVARINRKLFNAREALMGQQTYHVTVAPGMDMSLIAAMCICLDEKQNEGKGGACTVM